MNTAIQQLDQKQGAAWTLRNLGLAKLATGAIADAATLQRATALGLNGGDYLQRNDAYHFFQATGDLFITGLTQTNVMDVRVFLVLASSQLKVRRVDS